MAATTALGGGAILGAIAGDIIGSVYEGEPPPTTTFASFDPRSRFTDDSVLTIAVASAIRRGTDYANTVREWGRRYPNAGYGAGFWRWLLAERPAPYGSFGNGAAMRVPAIGWAFADLDTVLREARRSAEFTHDHPEGIKGAQAVAAAIFVARHGAGKSAVRTLLTERFGYACDASLDGLRARGEFDVSCQGTVPAAAAAFLASRDFEDAVRNAVSIGGDTDTLACIAGAIAEAHYGGVPESIQREALRRLDEPLRAEAVTCARQFGVPLHVDG